MMGAPTTPARPRPANPRREWGKIDEWCDQVVIYAIRDLIDLRNHHIALDLRGDAYDLDFDAVFDRVMDRPQVHIMFRRATEAEQEQMIRYAYARVTAHGIVSLLV